jgi:hypothetical protein
MTDIKTKVDESLPRNMMSKPGTSKAKSKATAQSGRRNSPVRSFTTSGDRIGSGLSQSMQRNLRPPVLMSMKCIGLLHLGQIGAGEFLTMGTGRERPRAVAAAARIGAPDSD